MKKLIPILIILAGAGYGAYYYYGKTQVVEKPQVVQQTVSQGDITEVVQATGSLAAIRNYNIGSQVSGIVKDVYVDYNSIVRTGQLIATIDPTLLQVQVELQSANVERQKGEIAIQEVQLEDAIRQAGRTKEMADKGLSTQQQLEQASLTVKQRQTSLDSARKQLLTAEANLNQAKLNVSYTNIYAPADGVVVERLVDPGQAVQASMTTPNFFRVATDLRTLRLSAGVDEAEIGKVRRGMRVTFTVDTYQNTTFEGEVEAVRLNAQTQNNVVTFPVWITVPNPDLRLKPSMTANIRIIVQTASNVVRIPNAALRFRPSNDMYTALGLTPPAPGQGRGLAGGGRNGGQPGQAPAAAAPGAAAAQPGPSRQGDAPSPAAAAGRQALEGGRQGGGDQTTGPQAGGRQRGDGPQARNGGQGGGRGQFPGGEAGPGGGARGRADFANMTPEQRQQAMAQFGGRGGNGQPGQGGRDGRGARGGRGQAASNTTAPAADLTSAERIDDLVPPVPTRITNGTVWTWNEEKKELTPIRVSTGISDGSFSHLVSGDVKVGQQIVSNIIVPLTAAQRQAQQQSIFGGQQGRGGFGGPQQGNFGGGQPGGGGGQRGGGGGGGRGGF